MGGFRLKYLTLPAVLAVGTITGNTAIAAWQKTSLATTSYQLNEIGFPTFDDFGDVVPALPSDYVPNFYWNSDGYRFLKVDHSTTPEPPELDDSGFPIFGDYFQLSLLTLDDNLWSSSQPITNLSKELNSPILVRRNDATVSFAHWIGDLLHIDTLASPANNRITLQVPRRVGAVAVDSNGAVHIAAVNPAYELWHYYYSDGNLTASKLSNGPVCDVVIVAGDGDESHLAYSTYSEDANLNDQLDEGEDLNGNSMLDKTPMQLVYQSVDATTPSLVELVDNDTLLKICGFDLHFSSTFGVKLAYADPVTNEVRLAERGALSWSSARASTVAGMFESIALAVDSAGMCAVSYVNAARNKLFVAEESSATWSETLISQVTTGDYFTGTNLAFDHADQLVVLTSEKSRVYLKC